MFENDTRFTGSTSPSFARNNAIRVHGYSSLSLFIFLTLRRRLKMSSRIIDKERGCVISVEGRCKQRCFSLRDPRSWRKIVNERVGSGSWPSKWQAENDALALRLRIQSGSRFRSPTANNYVIEASRVFLVGRGGRDRSPGSGEYYILASVHYVTGERQSLVGRIRDWILRGWRNLNPHLLPGGRTQEIQWVFATTPSDPIPFSSSSSFFFESSYNVVQREKRGKRVFVGYGEDTSPVARFSFGTTRLFFTVHCPHARTHHAFAHTF